MQDRVKGIAPTMHSQTYIAVVAVRSDRLKAARKARGLSQMALAEACKTSQVTISRLEQGATKDADAVLRRRLVAALGVPEAELFDDPEDARAPADPVLVRDPAPQIVSGSSTRLTRALGRAFNPDCHEIRDITTVDRALKSAMHFEGVEDAQLIEAAGKWLDAAAHFRRVGVEPSYGDLALRVTLGKTQRAREVDDAAGDVLNAEWDEKARAMGLEPGSGAESVRAALAPKKPRTVRDD